MESALKILKGFIALSYKSQMLLNLFLDAAGVSKNKKIIKMPEICSAGEIVGVYVADLLFPKVKLGGRQLREGLSFFLPFLRFYCLYHFKWCYILVLMSKVTYVKCVKETVSDLDICSLKTPTFN